MFAFTIELSDKVVNIVTARCIFNVTYIQEYTNQLR